MGCKLGLSVGGLSGDGGSAVCDRNGGFRGRIVIGLVILSRFRGGLLLLFLLTFVAASGKLLCLPSVLGAVVINPGGGYLGCIWGFGSGCRRFRVVVLLCCWFLFWIGKVLSRVGFIG